MPISCYPRTTLIHLPAASAVAPQFPDRTALEAEFQMVPNSMAVVSPPVATTALVRERF